MRATIAPIVEAAIITNAAVNAREIRVGLTEPAITGGASSSRGWVSTVSWSSLSSASRRTPATN
jgi:hypothetical protein